MLNKFRSAAQSRIVKFFLLALVVSFIVWGIGDIFRGRAPTTIASYGEYEISLSEYDAFLRREVNRYQNVLGKVLTPEQINSLNIKNIVLNEMINNRILRKRAEDIGLYVSEDIVKEHIRQNPAFAGENGKFDSDVFASVLRASGISQKHYIDMLKADIASDALLRVFRDSDHYIEALSLLLYKHRNQERMVDIVIVPKDYIVEVAEPAETDLVQFYQENGNDFKQVERRDISWIKFSPDDVTDEINLSEADLKQEYEKRIASYTSPETRKVYQYLFDSEEDARTAYDKLKAGKKIDETELFLGDVAREGLPESVSDYVFNIEMNRYSEPIESELGWHIFVVKGITPPAVTGFDTAKDQLRQEMSRQQAYELVYRVANQIEDDFAAGMSMEEVAAKYDLKVQKVNSVDREGFLERNDVKADIPDANEVLPLIFEADVKEASSLILLPDNESYLVYRVDAIKPERVMALDEVRGKVIKIWKERQRAAKAKEYAQEITKKLSEGKDVKAIVSGKNLSVKLEQSFLRKDIGEKSKLPALLADEIFSLKVGEASRPYALDDGSFAVAKLLTVREANIQKDASELEPIKKELAFGTVNDFLAQYNIYLRQKYPVKVNHALVDSVF